MREPPADAGHSPLRIPGLLIELDRSGGTSLRRQLEGALRAAIEDRTLPDGTGLPSSRSLAEQLGVSRGVVVDAYDQLTAQGFIVSRARRVPIVRAPESRRPAPPAPIVPSRLVLNPTAPDLSLFPRRLWARATAEALRDMPDSELDYPSQPHGAVALRAALVGYLSRVRRMRIELADVYLNLGYLHGLDLVCRALALRGTRCVAIENPSIPEQAAIVAGHGLEIVNVDVDEDGLVVEQLHGSAAGAVLVTPAHQFPLGAVLSPARRQALVAWAAERDALIVENDYDAEFRYDGPPIGAVQGLAPGRTACIGTTSKTLAPAVRLGWIAAPAAIAAQVAELQTHRAGFSGLNAHVLAQLMLTGAYERHVQRCRREYRRRRDALLEAISRELPELSALGAAGGLHLTLLLSPGMDATAVAEAARPLGLEIAPLSYYERGQTGKPPGLVVGYGRLPTAGVARAVKALSRALATTRASTGDRGRS